MDVRRCDVAQLPFFDVPLVYNPYSSYSYVLGDILGRRSRYLGWYMPKAKPLRSSFSQMEIAKLRIQTDIQMIGDAFATKILTHFNV